MFVAAGAQFWRSVDLSITTMELVGAAKLNPKPCELKPRLLSLMIASEEVMGR